MLSALKRASDRPRLTLLTARKLLDSLLFIVFAVEADADAYPSIVFNRFSSLFVF
jgi:hypothetical protein